MKVEAKVKEILKCQMYLQEEVKLSDHFEEDLGGDSLDAIEIIMELEDEFDIEIPDKEAEKLKTVADIVKCVEAKIEEKEKTEL